MTEFVTSVRDGSANTNDVALSVPVEVQDGDFLVAVIVSYNEDHSPYSVPSGWTLRGTADYGTSGFWRLYTKVASSESGTWTWSWLTYYGKRAAAVAVYRGGFDAADPIDVVSNTEYQTADTTLRAASMTLSANRETILFAGACYRTSGITCGAPTNPDTFTEDVDAGDEDSDWYHHFYHLSNVDAGATGDIDGTLSVAWVGKHAFAIALNPAPVSGPFLLFGKRFS